MSYQSLFDAYKRCYSGEWTKPKIQEQVNSVWNSLKVNKDSLETNVKAKIAELDKVSIEKKSKLLNFFVKAAKRQDVPATASATTTQVAECVPSTSSAKQQSHESSPVKEIRRKNIHQISSEDESDDDARPAPAQELLKKRITVLESQISSAVLARDSGLSEPNVQSKITKLQTELQQKKKDLSTKINRARLARKYRSQRQATLKSIVERDPDTGKSLKIRKDSGRPRVETDQPELLRAIVNIAKVGGAADERRRTDKIRTCKTLDDMQEALAEMGFHLSRSATYLRLLPRDSHTKQGKRHVVTVPVKLCRAQTSEHKDHVDGKFCTATIRSVETVVSILGPQQTVFISQDDKARVPIGITAANNQAPFLMHLEYKVTLPDHDWVVATRHKLIPSVYAGICIKDARINGDPSSITYSGPTYVAIRSGKHSSSNAATHAFDLNRLLSLPEFDEVLKVNGVIKPVLILSVDGGPDENPRYPKVIAHAIDHFRAFDLDGLYVFTNAPGRSAYNRVERRMAPLSRELSGVILPHDHFGTHLDASGKTIDSELEKENFGYAGQALAEIWSAITIDGYPVVSEYIQDGEQHLSTSCDQLWYAQHVRESQYFLQIAKCDNEACCKPFRSDLRYVLPNGFFPSPYPIQRVDGSLVAIEPNSSNSNDEFPPFLVRQCIQKKPIGTGFPNPLPYDTYCPSVHFQLPGRICSACGLYFATKINVDRHRKSVHKSNVSCKKVRPLKIFDQRSEEILCEVDMDGMNEILWLESCSVDKDGIIFEDSGPHVLPLVEFENWFDQPWTEDN